MPEAKIPILSVAASLSARQKRYAINEIAAVRGRHNGQPIVSLLQTIRRCCPLYVLAVAVEQVEGMKDGLSMDDQAFFAGFKQSLDN